MTLSAWFGWFWEWVAGHYQRCFLCDLHHTFPTLPTLAISQSLLLLLSVLLTLRLSLLIRNLNTKNHNHKTPSALDTTVPASALACWMPPSHNHTDLSAALTIKWRQTFGLISLDSSTCSTLTSLSLSLILMSYVITYPKQAEQSCNSDQLQDKNSISFSKKQSWGQ